MKLGDSTDWFLIIAELEKFFRGGFRYALT